MTSDPSRAEQLTVSVVDASRMLGISRSHAYELVARGELPSVKLGRRVLVPISALRALASAPIDH